ncbi:MAG: F0F1 ATP synthase subunit A [Oscillospiraceae bacterium]|jgi:F-type H+-transporting ATPase subunit a|nr:F0F1 ATP synthase subunit A [Oscillospiraceae bacterium]
MDKYDFLILALGFLMALGGFLGRRRIGKTISAQGTCTKKQKRLKRLALFSLFLGAWLFAVKGISMLSAHSAPQGEKTFGVSIVPERTHPLFGLEWLTISHTVLTTWAIIAIVLAASLIIRFTALKHMQNRPKGIQLLLEIAIEKLDQYVGTKLDRTSLSFGAYIFSLSFLLVASAFTELLGLHAPTADITMTLGLSLITFFLINYYGFKRKGLTGRIKSMANVRSPDIPGGTSFGVKIKLYAKSFLKPGTIAFPFRILSDLVVPLSLTCRLFGNMFGGMIIIDLLYYALGSAAVGIPSVAGLFFNVFHPLIQAFIFVTLTLSYIEEATAEEID